MTNEDNNHNVPGVVYHFIRARRELMSKERDFKEEAMNEFIEIYNCTVPSSIGKTPKDFTKKNGYKYMEKMNERLTYILLSDGYDLREGDRVRVILESNKLRIIPNLTWLMLIK